MKENNVPKKIDIEITIEFDKEIMEKVKKKQKYLPYTSGFMLLSFFMGLLFGFLYLFLPLFVSMCIFAVALFIHLSILFRIDSLEKKGREGHLPSSYASDLISCHSTMFPW